jgi:hypothetical protein
MCIFGFSCCLVCTGMVLAEGCCVVDLFGVIEERDDIRGRCSEEYHLRTDHAIPIPAS